MAKKRANKREKTTKVASKSAAKRKVAQKQRGKSAARKKRTRPGRARICRAVVVERDGALYGQLPVSLGKVLGTTDSAPVRVTLAGVDFYARAKGVHVTDSLLERAVPSPPNAIEFLLYKDMVRHLSPEPGQRLTVTIRREEHPPGRRGKRAR